MKKTTFLPLLGLFILASLLTAFTVQKVFRNDSDVTFKDFLKQFPKEKLPFEFSEKDLRSQLDLCVAYYNGNAKAGYDHKVNRLDWKYYKFLPGLDLESRFSRMPVTAEPVALLTAGDNIAVVYTSGYGLRIVYRNYLVTVFTKDGQFVSQNNLGGVGTEKANTFSFDRDLNVTVKSWDINWESDYSNSGIGNNKVTGLTQTDVKVIDLKTPTPKPEYHYKKELIAPLPPDEPAKPDGARTK